MFVNSGDVGVLVNAFLGFAVFWFMQFCVFRFWVKANLLRWMKFSMLAGILTTLCVQLRGMFWAEILLSVLIAAGLIFIYCLCVIALYESSIRLRIVREFYRVHPQGQTYTELLKNYNAEMILQKRLQRFIDSGELTFDGKLYKLGKGPNLFFGIAFILNLIRKAVKGS